MGDDGASDTVDGREARPGAVVGNISDENAREADVSLAQALESPSAPLASYGPHRAKAFILDTDSNDWEELATGTCAPDPSEDGAVFAIRLCAEEDPTTILFTATFHKDQQISIQNGKKVLVVA